MTTRPRLATGANVRNGIGAVLLFAVMAWTFVRAEFPAPRGFGEGEITRSIGFAMFDMLELIPSGHGETESFLVAFIIIAVVLDAALDGAIMLARREDDASVVSAVTDGGFPIGGSDGNAGDTDEAATAAADTADSSSAAGADGATTEGRDADDRAAGGEH